MDTNQNNHLANLSIDEISVKEGFNPRKFFEDTKYQELVESVAAHGVVQPIVVRPAHNEQGGYWIVAGERRYRAAKKAQLHQIPALIRDISEQEAKLIATIENTQRDDMSPAEEAEAARDVLMGCNNDRQEAIRLLGWSQSKFDSRLLLLHADKSVLDALTERKIKLGHAELLSQLPNDFQVATLEKILEHGYSVADLKDRLTTFALDLSKACFNISGCNGCKHNSSLQASLFDDHINGGKCANRACFEQKTEQAMLDKKAALSEQYAVIYLDTERRPDSFKVVCQSGSEAVGKSQFEQGCRQCAHFGALLNTSPSQLGKITEDCCFNLDCHAEKVAAYKALIKEQPMSAKPAVNASSNTKSVPAQQVASASKSTSEGKASAAVLPNKVTEKIETFYRELAAKTVTKDRRSVLCLNTFSLYQMVKIGFPKELWPDALQKKSLTALDLDGFLKLLADVSTEDIAAFNNRMVSHLLSDHEKSMPVATKTWAKGAVAAIKLIDVNLQEHFLLNKEFLGSFTKSGIESVLREVVNGAGVAFVEYYEKLDEKNKFPVLMKKKNTEILDEVFGCGYDFSGFVPACVLKVVGETKKAGRTEPILPKVEVPPATITESEPVAEQSGQSFKETDDQPSDKPSEKTESEQIDNSIDEDDGVLEQILTKTDSTSGYADFDDFDDFNAEQKGYGTGSFDYTQDPEEYDNETEESYV